jgi:hypothetical protein
MPSRVSQLVNYRSPRDSRWTWNWTLEGFYANRQDAERAARRWGNRGYKSTHQPIEVATLRG